MVFTPGFPGVWEIRRPDDVLLLLKSDLVMVPDYRELIGFAEYNWHIELPSLRKLVGMTPIFLGGPVLQEYRAALARYYARQVSRVANKLRADIPSILRRLKSLSVLDMELDFARPVTASMISAIVGENPPGRVFDAHLTEMFNIQEHNLSHLMRLDSEAGEALTLARNHSPDGQSLELVVSLLIFGVDSVIATILSNLWGTIRQSSRNGPVALRLPAVPVSSGVPVTYRVAKSDITIDGVRVAAGSILKLYMNNVVEHKVDHLDRLMFGVGGHSCLGRNIAMLLWTELSAYVNASDMRVFPIEVEEARHRFVPAYRKFLVGLSS